MTGITLSAHNEPKYFCSLLSWSLQLVRDTDNNNSVTQLNTVTLFKSTVGQKYKVL